MVATCGLDHASSSRVRIDGVEDRDCRLVRPTRNCHHGFRCSSLVMVAATVRRRLARRAVPSWRMGTYGLALAPNCHFAFCDVCLKRETLDARGASDLHPQLAARLTTGSKICSIRSRSPEMKNCRGAQPNSDWNERWHW